MTALFDYDNDDVFELKPVQRKKPKPRLKRCAICRASVEPDGYGCYVHSGTDDFPAAYYGCQYYDPDGYRIILKPADSRFAHVATAV
jgi:hypothetical protein